MLKWATRPAIMATPAMKANLANATKKRKPEHGINVAHFEQPPSSSGSTRML